MGLVTLSEAKTSLGISGSTYDTFLIEQIEIVSDAIEGYCGRKFKLGTYIQTIYRDDFANTPKELMLYHYPIKTLEYLTEDGEDVEDYRAHKPSGILTKIYGFFLRGDEIEVKYTAGFDVIPALIKSVVMTLLEERYNKKASGVALSFGSDVQRISIPGTISIDFDYSLDSNQRKNTFGTIIGSQANVLDPYRSERVLVGSGRLEYVDVAP